MVRRYFTRYFTGVFWLISHQKSLKTLEKYCKRLPTPKLLKFNIQFRSNPWGQIIPGQSFPFHNNFSSDFFSRSGCNFEPNIT